MRPKVSPRALAHVDRIADLARRLLDLERNSRAVLTRNERADALTWYVANRLRLERIAVDADLPGEVVVHVAATLSPATSWGIVLRDLPDFLARAKAGELLPPFATYGRQRYLAARIVALGVDAVGGAKGPKVRPFALALLGDASQVVVDRHVARYALGDPDRVAVSAPERRAIQDAHRVAGTALGVAPRDLQSLLWVARVGFDGDPGGTLLKRAARAGPEVGP